MPVAIGEQAVVAAESIGVNRAALRDPSPNDSPQHRPGHSGDRPGVDLAAPLQEPKDNDFASHRSASQMLADAAKVALVHFNFSLQPGLPFTALYQGPANHRIDPLGRMAIDADLPSGSVGGHLHSKEANEHSEAPRRQLRSGQQGGGHGSAYRGLQD